MDDGWGAAQRDLRTTQLIELGRDREAAELAGAPISVGHDLVSERGGHMDVLSQLDEVGTLLGGVVGNLSPDDLTKRTPCAQFEVRGVLEHMVGGATMFAAAFRGEEPGTPPSDVLAGFAPALTNLVDAIRAPGALDKTVSAPFGDVPGSTFAQFVVLDGLVHGWDMATATGQPYQPSDALVDDVQAFASGALGSLRDGTTFADPAEPPPDATPMERLAAFTGRVV